MEKKKNGILVDMLWFIGLLVFLVLFSLIGAPTKILVALYIMYFGFTFFASEKMSSFGSRIGVAVYYFATKVLTPRSEKSHILWGYILVVMSVLAFLSWTK